MTLQRIVHGKTARAAVLAAVLAGMMCVAALGAQAQQAPPESNMPGHDMSGHDMSGHGMDSMNDMGGMEGMEHMAAPAQAGRHIKSPEELAADKRFSEFNHHIAGFFVLLVGLVGFLEAPISARWRGFRYLWAFLFVAPGLYLLGWSDPEAWPFGNQTLMHVITQNLQVLQHKLFSLILIALGIVEYIRVRRARPSVWLSSIFPVLAGAGALMLLFHPHGSDVGMGGAEHLIMMKIQKQHVEFAATGFGIALSKGFSDVGRFHPRLMRGLFAALMCVLGLLLLTYTE